MKSYPGDTKLVVGVLVLVADRLFNVVIVIGGCVCGGGGGEDSSGESI